MLGAPLGQNDWKYLNMHVINCSNSNGMKSVQLTCSSLRITVLYFWWLGYSIWCLPWRRAKVGKCCTWDGVVIAWVLYWLWTLELSEIYISTSARKFLGTSLNRTIPRTPSNKEIYFYLITGHSERFIGHDSLFIHNGRDSYCYFYCYFWTIPKILPAMLTVYAPFFKLNSTTNILYNIFHIYSPAGSKTSGIARINW